MLISILKKNNLIMKKTFVLTFSFLLIINFLHAQNEFGAVGSYWMYTHIPHSTPNSGETMISVEKDTLIEGKTYKILRKKYSHYIGSVYGPPHTGDSRYGLMQIVNDSVFIGENELVLDFNMTLDDSLLVDGIAPIQMIVDSIGAEIIDGVEYKKWYGQKLCLADGQPYPYETFTILEHIGQIDDYLFWNTDNCSIGGDHNIFKCYKNGDFTYPPSTDCAPLLISTTQVNDIPGLELFPNPVDDILNVSIKDLTIKEVLVFDVKGKEILREENNTDNIQINTGHLERGTYLIQIQTKNEITTRKFIKV